MPRISDHEEYLNATMVSNGDQVVLLDAGIYREPEETGFNRTIFHIRVKLPDGRNKTWSMNKTTQRRLAKAYGDDSSGWVNRSARIEILSQNVRGEVKEVLYGHPVEGGPTPQQVKIEDTASKAQKIVEHIVAHTAFSTEQINDMVAEELKNSGNLFNVDMAAVLVARTLKVSLETTGERIA